MVLYGIRKLPLAKSILHNPLQNDKYVDDKGCEFVLNKTTGQHETDFYAKATANTADIDSFEHIRHDVGDYAISAILRKLGSCN